MNTLAVIQLALSFLILLLTIWVWRKSSSENKVPPAPESESTMVWESQELIRQFNEVSVRVDETLKTLPKPIDTEDTRFVAGLLIEYENWADHARRIYRSEALAQETRENTNRIGALLNGLKYAHRRHISNAIMDQFGQMREEIVYGAVRDTDQDIDRERSRADIQVALRRLVQSANLEMIDPKPGYAYQRRDAQLAITVGKVRRRGLRVLQGDVIYEPEIQESR
jgi:hypothetical protein